MGIITTRLIQSFWAAGNSKPGAESGVSGGVVAGVWAKPGAARHEAASAAASTDFRFMRWPHTRNRYDIGPRLRR